MRLLAATLARGYRVGVYSGRHRSTRRLRVEAARHEPLHTERFRRSARGLESRRRTTARSRAHRRPHPNATSRGRAPAGTPQRRSSDAGSVAARTAPTFRAAVGGIRPSRVRARAVRPGRSSRGGRTSVHYSPPARWPTRASACRRSPRASYGWLFGSASGGGERLGICLAVLAEPAADRALRRGHPHPGAVSGASTRNGSGRRSTCRARFPSSAGPFGSSVSDWATSALRWELHGGFDERPVERRVRRDRWRRNPRNSKESTCGSLEKASPGLARPASPWARSQSPGARAPSAGDSSASCQGRFHGVDRRRTFDMWPAGDTGHARPTLLARAPSPRRRATTCRAAWPAALERVRRRPSAGGSCEGFCGLPPRCLLIPRGPGRASKVLPARDVDLESAPALAAAALPGTFPGGFGQECERRRVHVFSYIRSLTTVLLCALS